MEQLKYEIIVLLIGAGWGLFWGITELYKKLKKGE
jgi:hypothetical protein